jgi:hypothetical protein
MRYTRVMRVGRGIFALGTACLLALGSCQSFSGDDSQTTPADASVDGLLPDASVDALPPDASLDASPTGCDAGAPPQDDPKNCGACGFDCEGGACVGGLCQPVVVVTGLARPYAVVADDEGVYFTTLGAGPATNEGALYTCDGDPCTSPKLLGTANRETPKLLALTQNAVFVAPRISTTSPTGGSMFGYSRVTKGILASYPFGARSPQGIFGVRGQKDLYFSDSGDATNGSGADLYHLTAAASGYTIPVALANVPNAYGLVAATASKVVVTDKDRTLLYQNDNMNSRVAGHAIVDLTSNGADVFWSTTHTTTPTIWRCSTGCSGNPQQVGTALVPTGLVADATGVYWVNAGNTAGSGTVSWLKEGGVAGQQELLKNLASPQRIAVTTKYLYITTFGAGPGATGQLLRVVKPL